MKKQQEQNKFHCGMVLRGGVFMSNQTSLLVKLGCLEVVVGLRMNILLIFNLRQSPMILTFPKKKL